MKQKVIVVVGIAAAVLAVTGFVLIFQKQIRKVFVKHSSPKSEPSTPSTPSSPSTQIVRLDFPLQTGSKGKYVVLLQSMLNFLNNANLVLDGDFGSKTRDAIVDFPPYKSSAFSSSNLISISRSDFNAYKELVQKKFLNGWQLYARTNFDKIKNVSEKYGQTFVRAEIDLFSF